MEFHAIADEWPLMEGGEFDSLVASVARHGVRVPCWKYEGKVLDGRNRCRAAEAAGVEVLNWHTFAGTEDEARELARLLNDERRHLTRESRAEWVRKLREKGMSTRAIADAVGVGIGTVHRDLKAGVPDGTPEPAPEEEPTPCPTPAVSSAGSSTESVPRPESPEKVTGLDGKKYAATRPQAKATARPSRPTAPVMTAGEWSEFFVRLEAVVEFTQTITPSVIPQELETWQLLQHLETTARSILAAATRLRRSP